MNQAIEKRIQELSLMINGSYEDIKKVTSIEFGRTAFTNTKHNYFAFIDNLKCDELNHMLNHLALCKEG
ncbi:hypothetical protein [Staphylococcus succinus]|uniref:hypothetical protein n=1 Tax=Staphylococcus succinus TaxID=61015 RepID=UPI0009363E03|nr:hypothetical protein [Staphylococcus succinus]